MPRYAKRSYSRGARRVRTTRKDKVKKLVDGKGMSRIERISRQYIGPMGTIAKTVYGMSKLINSEQKMINQGGSGGISTTGSITLLSGVAQGVTDNTRIGNSFIYQNMLLNFALTANGSSPGSIVRMVLFVDKETNGVAPTVSDVIGPTPGIITPLNEDNTKRFVILKNKLITLTSFINIRQWKSFHQLPFHAYYGGTGDTVADCKENQIYMLLISDVSTNTPAYEYYSRIKFTDN